MSCPSCKSSSCKCKTSCGCSSSCSCNTCPTCTAVCTALVVTNSWNVPSCGAEAVLSIPGLTTVLIGSIIYSPTYGQFRITAFNSVNGEVTVINDCLPGNAAPGTVVPALTTFIFSAPTSPFTVSSFSSWVIPACDGSVVVDAPGFDAVLLGSYLYNPTYGYFKITAFNSSTDEITLLNQCFAANAAPTTVVPAQTIFIFVDTPVVPELVPVFAWTVPACAGTVVVEAPGVVTAPVDAYVYNSAYGYFRVTAFNPVTWEVTLANDCFEGNAAPTTVVPAETPFIFVDTPSPIADNGWSEARETWTFASAQTINVPAGADLKYQKGDKIWIVQSAVDKFFSVVDVAPALLTVYGGATVVTNVTIEEPKYSHQESPVGFPPYFDWTPVITASGAMTVAVVANDQNRIRVVGGYAEFDSCNRVTLGGVADTTINISLPFPVAGDTNAFTNFVAQAEDTGGSFAAVFRTTPAPAILLLKLAAVNWALGAAIFGVRGRVAI